MNYFRRFREAVVCVVLLAVPFFFLRANLKDPSRANWLDRALLQASAPVQYLATTFAQGVSNLIADYTYLVDVKRENERLQKENGELRLENRRLRNHAQENTRLRQLLSLREDLKADTLTARVIGKEVSPLFRVIRLRLDRGDFEGVRAGMPVIASDGLVGQIRRVWGRYSDVLLTADRTSAVDIIVHRTGARGILRGTGESDNYAARVQYLQRSDDVRVGDEVHTSGLGHRFPAGILVGHITYVNRKSFGLYQEAKVTPAVNVAGLEEVLVLRAGAREKSVGEEEWSGGGDD